MRKLLGKLTYANVMASVAVFIALGAGAYAAINLPKNSVKSKHIAPRQVKPPDLGKNVRAIRFSYSKPIDTIVQSNVLNAAGYRIVAQCLSDAGRPEIEVGLIFPRDGVVDGIQGLDRGPDPAIPIAGRFEVEGGDPLDATADFHPNADGEVAQISGSFTYDAARGGALLNFSFRSDDTVDRCTITGALVPTN